MANRVHRVWSVLHGKPPFDDLFKSEPLIEMQFNDEEVRYPQVCVDIAQSFFERSLDACTVQKINIVREACRFYNVDMNTVPLNDTKPDIFEEALPTASRIRRVESVLASAGLVEEKAEVLSADGLILALPTASKIAQEIHAAKLDACTMKKADIFKRWKKPEPVAVKPPESHVVSEPEPEPEPPAPAPPSPPPSPSPPMAEQVKPKAKKKTPSPPAPVVADKVEVPAPARPAEDAVVDIAWNLSVYTLLVSAYQISQLDKRDGHQARRKRIEELANEYYRSLA